MTRRSASFRAPLQLPIWAGATTPDPAYVGTAVYSTIAFTTLFWTGASWQPAALGGRGVAVIDFGSSGISDARAVVTGQPLITASSVVLVKVAILASANHSADEHFAEELSVFAGAIVPGTGFTIFARTNNLEQMGQYNVYWMWS